MKSKSRIPSGNTPRENLPGYIADTLSADLRAQLEIALRDDPALRLDLKEFEAIAASFSAQENISIPHAELLFQRINANINAVPQTQTIPPAKRLIFITSLRNSMRRWFGEPRLAWGIALAQLAVIAVLVIHPGRDELTYSVLSAGSEAHAEPLLRVVFDPTATQQQVQHLMRKFDLRFVDGPSEAGGFTVALPPGAASAQAVVEQLRLSSIVRFAEIALTAE